MVVTCPSCGTRFNLDEALLSGDAAKVRCSRCQQVFQVARPGAPPSATHLEMPSVASDLFLDLDTPDEQATPTEPPPAPAFVPEPAPAPREPTAPAPPAPEPAPVAPPAPELRPSRGPLVLSILGGVLLGLVLGVVGLWYAGAFKMGPLLPAKLTSERVIVVTPPLPAGPEELKGLVLEAREARYRGLVNKKGGQLLVIQGEVVNDTTEPRGPIQLKATLTDDRDRMVGDRLFYSGTTLSDQELKDLDPDEIHRWLDAPGGRDQAFKIMPGDKQAFTAVFFGVPADLAAARYGFTLAVVQGPRAPNP